MHTEGGVTDRPDMMKVMPHPDGGIIDGGGDAPAVNPCGANGSTLGLGDACGCDAECGSNHCVEGVCCNSACTSGCQTCTGTKPGTCVGRAANSPPRKSSDCPIDSPSSCGLNGMCDGAGTCQNYFGNTCVGGTCSGDSVLGAFACDGSGGCKAGVTQMLCIPYSCDTNTGMCFQSCTSAQGGQCDPKHSCDLTTGSCGKVGIGAHCSGDADCISGNCADSVCCNIACKGACVACNLPGRLGACSAIDSGKPDPRGVCKDQGAASCGHNGTCDGVGGCANYTRDTQCLEPSCTGNRLNTAGTCDGLGRCRPPGVQDCHPFRCVNGACTKSCQSVDDCDQGTACLPVTTGTGMMTCGPKPRGASCQAASECSSNFCVDGVCCQSACGGTCQYCALPTSPGFCMTVAADNVDPRGLCQDKGAASCGTNGKCDGTGSCATYGQGTVCAGETCVSGVFTAASTCNMTGQCVAPDSRPCAPFLCNGNECFNICGTSDQCKTPNTCNAMNSCGLKGPGAVCASTPECQLGLSCAQGYCCNSPCAGACQSCALSGSVGTCTNVPANQVDPSAQCVDKLAPSCNTNGKCDGNGSCQLYVQGTACLGSTCPGGTSTFTGTSSCDGAGQCVTPNAAPCFPYQCGVNICKNSCAADSDCASPAVCINGSCGLKPAGQACVTAAECSSGFCSQSVCCATACTGVCQSCALTTAPGTCSNVSNGTADPQGTCHDQGNTTCGTDGFCDGSGACRKYAGGTSCAAPSCPASGTTLTSGRTCDGKGTCQTASTIPCAPYVCNGSTACKAACGVDSDCQTPMYICDPKTGLCGTKHRLGQSCAVSSDCLTGNSCVDGVCCSATACATCQACNITGSAGNCANVPASSLEPHGLCATSPPCGNTGACDGAGKCQLGGTGVSCGTATCSGSTFTPVSHCNGTGACAAPVSSTCPGGFVCDTSNATCKTACTLDTDCVAPLTCQGSGSTKSCALKPNGQTCASANQCISGFCTDGVCCGSGSCGTCKACNVNGAGSCAAIASGTTAPSGQCGANGTCGNTGTCNGGGACTQAATSVSCAAASCTGTTFTPTAFCSGGGSCSTATTSSCAPYVCGGTSCKTTCSVDGDCVPAGGANSYCTGSGGACLPVKAMGVACFSNHECGSGNCVDGVCCGSASCPTCQACNVTGSGACANVANNVTEPHVRCGANGTCGNTGTCNGSGACTQSASSVSCAAASCSGTTFTPTAFCSGSGTCSAPTTASCAPYVCGGTSCNNSCSGDAQCVPSGGNNTYCTGTNGSCLPVKSLGVACLSNHECGSGNCVDGVCCSTTSCGTCMACNVAGSPGTCTNVGNTVTEPHTRCSANGTCGNTGTCNGAGACTQAGTSVTCAPASCSGTTFTPVAFCNGAGACSAASTSSCSPYLCSGSSCSNSCSADTDCVNTTGNNNYCTGTNGSCLPVKSNGVACLTNHECGSNFCVDGVCCASNSCGTCMACNVSGSLGSCGNVANNVTDPHTRCTPGGTCGNTGACNGSGACQQQPTSVMCSGPSCTGGTATLASFCSGAGSCPAAMTAGCGDYLCGTTSCKTSCTADSDCISTDYCTATSNGTCTPRKALGKSCAVDDECGSGFCTDGVCCNANACGTCQSCNLNGAGTCSAMAANQPAPSGQCTVGSTCGNTGLCNGASGCQQRASGISCGSASCVANASQFTAAPTCNGSGSCVTPSPISCGSGTLKCNASGCPAGCTVDGDCVNGYYCNGSGTCVAQHSTGSCTGGNQCTTGNCTNGFCCDVSACPTCQACGASGSCTALPSTTVCASSCAIGNLSLSQNFCDSGACSVVPVVTLCPTLMCDATVPTCQ